MPLPQIIVYLAQLKTYANKLIKYIRAYSNEQLGIRLLFIV